MPAWAWPQTPFPPGFPCPPSAHQCSHPTLVPRTSSSLQLLGSLPQHGASKSRPVSRIPFQHLTRDDSLSRRDLAPDLTFRRRLSVYHHNRWHFLSIYCYTLSPRNLT